MKKSLFVLLYAFIFIFTLIGCQAQKTSHNTNKSETYGGTIEEDLAIVDSADVDSAPAVSKHTVIETDKSSSAVKDSSQSTGSVSAGQITRDYAKSVALKSAGVNETEIYDLEIELDLEMNRKVYEIRNTTTWNRQHLEIF